RVSESNHVFNDAVYLTRLIQLKNVLEVIDTARNGMQNNPSLETACQTILGIEGARHALSALYPLGVGPLSDYFDIR
ncbi:MAG: hypothetical protein COU64_03685, partial [Candidatus Pacebacteria bacterium CG10_big_fil_rev_8_21_14_0_10_40_26]